MSAGSPYLLDTTVLIDASRRREPATSWLGEILQGPGVVCVSAVTVAEFFAGVQPERRLGWQEFIDQLVHVDVSREIAVRTGNIRYCFARQGRTIVIPDAVIASTAVRVGAALVTASVKDFSVPGIVTIRLI